MRVVHLSTQDIGGGAARGSYALHEELVRQGVESFLVVEQRASNGPSVLGDGGTIRRMVNAVRHRLDRLALQAYRSRDARLFSLSAVPGNVVGRVRALEPDLVHLHWVGASFVRPEDLGRFGVPIVWTMRDTWAYSGGCHYTGGCERYRDACGRCPGLGSTREADLSRWLWSRKQRSWENVAITPVAMSSWTREQALASSLFGWRDIRLIHNAIDVDFWTPQPKDIARDALDVPRNGKVVLFISTKIADEHKGFAYFADACRQLSDDRSEDEVHALVVGAAESEDRVDLGIPARYAGMLSDDTVVRQAYAAADVTVVPSTEEAFGKTAAESLACGTPVVSFDETGLVDVVGHKTSGYRATPFEASDIKRGIKWVLEDDDRWSALSTAGRTAVKQRFSVRSVAKEYIALYDEILGDGRAGVAFDG